MIPIYRNDKLENVYWTFSYSKVDNDQGKTGGVLVYLGEVSPWMTKAGEFSFKMWLPVIIGGFVFLASKFK